MRHPRVSHSGADLLGEPAIDGQALLSVADALAEDAPLGRTAELGGDDEYRVGMSSGAARHDPIVRQF